MAGEAWRSDIPDEETEAEQGSRLRNEAMAAKCAPEIAGWFLFFFLLALTIAIGIAVGVAVGIEVAK